ncbi:hypothetical protein GCM10010503_02850 [Streptomyces lucensis JCM 4490]|uniref:Uncharacterized protein n=1 Tax=Streptomyces lucensis JCM 4490 TaxID=1306176 RepID=A0A918IVT9_9ACTN|nr:hypothetical protein [Streptomyces lucensis]GGW30676.1 hypothetical protein GCM10010503_02850 [Streptomyces lucensis JCM 4490]
MGGNGWTQTGPYQRDLEAAFRRAQEAELAQDDHGFGPGRTVEELWLDPAWHEYIFTGGTGSVLDFPAMTDPSDTDDGPFMRPLSEAEIRAFAPDGRPTYADWDEALDSERLDFPDRAQGRCTVLYTDGEPTHIGYWGVTAD